jgi:hypothetical protein
MMIDLCCVIAIMAVFLLTLLSVEGRKNLSHNPTDSLLETCAPYGGGEMIMNNEYLEREQDT